MGTPTLRTNTLTTLEALKQLLDIGETDTSQDSMLTQLINRVSTSVKSALGRKLRRNTYAERMKGTGSQYLLVENCPIVTVEEIKQVGEIIGPGLYDITVYGNVGVTCKDNGRTYYGLPHGSTGDAVTGSRNITVRYTAEYILLWGTTGEAPVDLPADPEGLTQEMVQYIFGKLGSSSSSGPKAFSISDVHWERSDKTSSSWQNTVN